jgi:hypothetical protein
MIRKGSKTLYLTREKAAALLTEHGLPISESQLAKKHTEKKGPPVESYWGRRPLFTAEAVLAWAKAQLRSELPATHKAGPGRPRKARPECAA